MLLLYDAEQEPNWEESQKRWEEYQGWGEEKERLGRGGASLEGPKKDRVFPAERPRQRGVERRLTVGSG